MANPFHHNRHVKLLPVPDASPQDPLNWSSTRKWSTILAVTFASFAAVTAASTGNLAYPIQAKVYQKSVATLSYTSAASSAGIAVGPLLLAPFSEVFGRTSLIFWSLLLGSGVSIWSACMTNTDDFVPFLISRIFAGILASLPGVFGSSIIMDICFLHDRGKAFLVYAIGTAMGNVCGLTFGGYIVALHSWTIVFWWVVPLQIVASVVVFFVCSETGYQRGNPPADADRPQSSWLRGRLDTFLLGSRVAKHTAGNTFFTRLIAPFKIGLSPIGFTAGFYLLIIFGWVIMLDILSVVFLQTPIKLGGYAFNPIETANVTWAIWIALFAAQLYGMLINDTVPILICKRFYRGTWRPELRLHCLWPCMILMPIGLGLYGAALAQHFHYMVLAFALFLVAFSGLLALPIVINYLSEIFENHATECIIVLNFYRLAWGVAIPFFLPAWEAAVRINWIFGTAAFLTIGASFILLLLIMLGGRLRKLSMYTGLVSTEAGETLIEFDAAEKE